MPTHKDRLSDFNRDTRILKISMLAGIVGVMSTAVACGLLWLIRCITNLVFFQDFTGRFHSPAENHLGYWVVLVPAAGGLLIGLMARYGSEKIRGHGIPEALEAILIGKSRMSPKVAVLKPVSSALSIGTGGPFGAEGPIIMTGGAFGSLFAQIFRMSSVERKTLLVAGAAAGMAAIFATPFAAVLLAVELLLFEWKPRSFIPIAVACVVAGVLRVRFLGPGPIFPVAAHAPLDGSSYVYVALVGLLAGFGSALLTLAVYSFEDLFKKLPVHWMWWPAIGGLLVGLGGLVQPRVLGVGYDVIHDLLQGHLLGTALLGLLIMKTLVWCVALGSGTSGGVLAPLLIIGGALGALEAHWIPAGDASLWAMISMAALMGGTMRAPLTAVIFALELTHDFNVMSPLLVACIAAYTVTVLMMRRSILTEKVARRGYHITREYGIDPLELLRVGEVMDKDVQTVPATMKVSEFADLVANRDPAIIRHKALPVVDEQQRMVSIVTHDDVLAVIKSSPGKTVFDVGSKEVQVAYPDELVREAMNKMLRFDVGRLPVVERADPDRVVGYLGRPSVFLAWMRRLEEEHERESSWEKWRR